MIMIIISQLSKNDYSSKSRRIVTEGIYALI